MVDVTHDGHDGRTADQVFLVRLLDHLDGLLGRFLHVVLEHRDAELLGHRFDGGHVQGLGDRGDDSLEEQGFDDLGALDAEHVGQLLHREVVLRNNDHFGPHLLGLARGTKLHGPTPLPLTGGFLLALPHRRHRLGRGLFLRLRLGGASQAG